MWDMHYMGSVISQGLQGFITVVSHGLGLYIQSLTQSQEREREKADLHSRLNQVINSTADHSAVKWSVEQGKEKLTSTSAVPEPTADPHTEL
jgi:Na+-translocating ferredoxin:NAD+ oxidoreductase RnfG subunit